MQIPTHSFRSSLPIDFPPPNVSHQEFKRKYFSGFQSSSNEKCEVKVVPLRVLKVYVKSWGADPLARNLGCSWRWEVSVNPEPIYALESNLVPLYHIFNNKIHFIFFVLCTYFIATPLWCHWFLFIFSALNSSLTWIPNKHTGQQPLTDIAVSLWGYRSTVASRVVG